MKRRVITALAAVVLAATHVMANDTIDKLFSKAETLNGAKVTVQEQRDPETGKLTKHSWYVECNDPDGRFRADVAEALQKERPKAIRYTQTENKYYMAEFLENGTLYTYMIVIEPKKVTMTLYAKPYTPQKKTSQTN